MIEHIFAILGFMGNAFIHIWPYLLITIPIAVAVNMSGASAYIKRAFDAGPVTAVFLATLVGAFSPFCSCGVIPVVAALLIGGVPLAPVMSFWIASPSMDPEIFFLSVGMLGWDLSVWRLAGTLVLSLGSGLITLFLVRAGHIPATILKSSVMQSYQPKASVMIQAQMPVEEKNCCDPKARETFIKTLSRATMDATFMVVKFMALAFFLEALIVLYVPEDWVIRIMGRQNTWAVLTAALLGIPVYTSNLSAIPMAGGLLAQGMSPGAALAFLVAGPTTTLPAMAAVWTLVRPPIFMLYLGFALVGAVFLGYLKLIFT
ncbi:MAG TPA: permease [Desulfobacteraceae bacterium]|nr:permease [Desulfobacteraceae bacterium]